VRRLLLMALLVVGTMGEQRGTLAYLTATAGSSANTFVAGKVELSLGANPALWTLSGVYPGADPTYAPITVQNAGSVSLRYALRDEVANGSDVALATALQLTVKLATLAGDCTAAGFASIPTTLYGPASLVPAGGKVLGDKAVGSHTGDRTLAPGSSDILCFQVSLPSTAATTLQNKTSDVQFTFDAEQLSGT
jgi:hypothetical protein